MRFGSEHRCTDVECEGNGAAIGKLRTTRNPVTARTVARIMALWGAALWGNGNIEIALDERLAGEAFLLVDDELAFPAGSIPAEVRSQFISGLAGRIEQQSARRDGDRAIVLEGDAAGCWHCGFIIPTSAGKSGGR